jgi:hypothetical protein
MRSFYLLILGTGHLRLVMGTSMGAMHTWVCLSHLYGEQSSSITKTCPYPRAGGN